MKILDVNDNEILEEEIDLSVGYLVSDFIVTKHHDAVEEVSEEGHLEYATFYFTDGTEYHVEGPDDPHVTESGYVNLPGEEPKEVHGADQVWVIDKPQVDKQDAWDETETVKRYVLYTEDELIAVAKQKAIDEFVENGPEMLADVDDALCTLYELTEAQQVTIDEQDDAICLLYEMIGA